MILQVGHADRILDVVSTPDGQILMTASQDSTIRVWSLVQNALLRVLTGHSVGATAPGLAKAAGGWSAAVVEVSCWCTTSLKVSRESRSRR